MVEIRQNIQKSGIELKFTDKPDDSVIQWMKDSKYRWSPHAMVWYKLFSEKDWKLAHEYFNIPVKDTEITDTMIDMKKSKGIEKDALFLYGLHKQKIEKKPSQWDINLFKKSFLNKIRKASQQDKDQYIELLVNLANKDGIAPVFTKRHSIYNFHSDPAKVKAMIGKKAGAKKITEATEKETEGKDEKQKIIDYLIKIGSNPADAKKQVDQQYDYVARVYKESPISKKAEVVTSLYEPEIDTDTEKSFTVNDKESKVWSDLFDKLDGELKSFHTDSISDFNKVKNYFVQSKNTPDNIAGIIAAYYQDYRAGAKTKPEAISSIINYMKPYLKDAGDSKPDTKKSYTVNELNEKYPASDGYYGSILEIDTFDIDGNYTKRYWSIKKETGEKTVTGRKVYEDFKYFRELKDGGFVEVDNPYKKKTDPDPEAATIEVEGDIAMQEADQEFTESNTVGQIRPDFMETAILKGREITLSMPNGEKRKGQFVIAELGSIIASHDEENFHSSPVYPKNKSGNNINDRNYTDDKSAQKAVIDNARDLEPERLITTSRTPSGTPIVTTDGFVVSGNNRTMSLKLAEKEYPANYEGYKQFLKEELQSFGINFSDFYDAIDGPKFKSPVLIRIDYDFPEYTTQELAKYNKDTKKSERPVDKAIKLSNILRDNPNCARLIAETTGDYDTFSEFYATQGSEKKLAGELVSCNLLTVQELPSYFTGATFTETGKEFIENLLAALILERDALIASELPGVRGIKQKLITSLPILMKNANLPEGSLKQNINDAVMLQHTIKSSGNSFADWIRQHKMFGETYDRKTIYLNRLLDSGKLKFKKAIEGYNDSVVKNQGADLFGEKPTIEQIFEHHIIGAVDELDKKLIEGSAIVDKPETPTEMTEPESKFKIGDIVAHKHLNTIGIVREVFDGEVKTDADGMVAVKNLELYDPEKHLASYQIAPSTAKELGERLGKRQIETPTEMAKEYKYIMMSRPFDIGTYPKEGFLRYEPEGSKFGTVIYNRKLPIEEFRKWSFIPETEIEEAVKFDYYSEHYEKYVCKWLGTVVEVLMYEFASDEDYTDKADLTPADFLTNIQTGYMKPIKERTATETSKPETPKITPANIQYLRRFIGESQIEAIMTGIRGEEGEFFRNMLSELIDRIKNMPETYQTENVETPDKIVYLHYFSGGSDWYVVEKDAGVKGERQPPAQYQAFGYVVLNGDLQNAELGYISIPELLENNVELDLYWEPKRLGEIIGGEEQDKQQMEEEENDQSREWFGYQFEFKPVNKEGRALRDALTDRGVEWVKQAEDGMSINVAKVKYKGTEFSFFDNSGEFKVDGPEGMLANIYFKENDNLKPISILADELLVVFMNEGKDEDVYVVTERKVRDKVIIMLQNKANGEMRSVTLHKNEVGQYNRNKQADIDTLWKMTEEPKPTDPIVADGSESGDLAKYKKELENVERVLAKPTFTGAGMEEKAEQLRKKIKELEGDEEVGKSNTDLLTSLGAGATKSPLTALQNEVKELADEVRKTKNTGLIVHLENMIQVLRSRLPEVEGTKGWVKNAEYAINYAKEIIESVGKVADDPLTKEYKNEYQLNKAIEKLLDQKWNDPAENWTQAQLDFIKQYTGLGGLKDQALAEGDTLDVGILYEFYTPAKIIQKMWDLARHHGYDFGPVLEPAVGIGSFFDSNSAKDYIMKEAYEPNKYSAKICKLLHPEVNINNGADSMRFEQLFLKNNASVKNKVTPKFDLVIGNPPYGKIGGEYITRGEEGYTKARNWIDYFIFRGLDLLHTGGLLVFIIGAEVGFGGTLWLDLGDSKCKQSIAEKADLIDAYRLPSGVFDRTGVASDIIIMKRK